MGRVGIWIRNLAIAAVVVTFVFFFGQQTGMDGGVLPVAEVNSEPISRDVFEFFREQNEQTFRQFNQQGIDSKQLGALIDEQTRSSLVRRYVMAQEAESLGLGVSDESLRSDFQANFLVDGKFDRAGAENAIDRTGLGRREYTAQHRRDLLMRNFSRFVASPVRVSDAEVRAEILRNGTQLQLRYATAGKGAFRAQVKVTDDEATALVASEPERVRGAYQLRSAEFTREEQIRARHILFTGLDAEALAIAARGRLEAGTTFADLAKELSADAATRAEGGDLGTFPRGRMLPAFDEAAFALEPGKPSGPVKTERGVHLILVESHEQAKVTPFEEVSTRLALELLGDDKAAAAAREAANALLAKLAAGEPFVASAESLKLPVAVTAPFGLRDPSVPGLAGVADLKEAAFALSQEQPHANRVFSDAENLYVVSLQSRDEPNEEQVAAETAATRERLVQRARGLTTSLWFSTRLKQLEASGDVMQFALQTAR